MIIIDTTYIFSICENIVCYHLDYPHYSEYTIYSDIDTMIANDEIQYFFESPKIVKEMLVWKKNGTGLWLFQRILEAL